MAKTPNQHELRLRQGARMVTVPDGLYAQTLVRHR